ncbi:unnamed protein product [Umbelopsis ramanniana]
MVLPRAYVSRFTPLSQTYYFKPLSIMNPFQQLQQKADRMQGGGGGSGGQQNEEAQLWKNKLIGKTLIDDGQETELGEDQVFLSKNLPKPFRVLKRDSFMTMDYRPERMNVTVDDDKKITGVNFS